jgi:hypothetical protein
MQSEDTLRTLLQEAAVRSYGERRASELSGRLAEIARWMALIDQQPLDLLDEEPEANGG